MPDDIRMQTVGLVIVIAFYAIVLWWLSRER